MAGSGISNIQLFNNSEKKGGDFVSPVVAGPIRGLSVVAPDYDEIESVSQSLDVIPLQLNPVYGPIIRRIK